MESISDLELEKVSGGRARAAFVFFCPHCKRPTDMRLTGKKVTCLACGQQLLNLNTVNIKHRDSSL